ncbi:MAG: GreA/GreB family elongation factor [Dehalococcoidia bacterium]
MTPSDLSFSEALAQYVAVKKNGKKALEGQQEISRFISWFGRDRKINELSPAQVADYAQLSALRGADSVQKLGPVKTFLGFLKDEGWIETSLAAHLRVPRTRRTTAGPRRTTTGAQPTNQGEGATLSQEGYDRLLSQLESLKEERIRVTADIKRAMEDKDFRENAPLDAAKERQGIIEARIREIETGLTGVQILSEDSNKGGQQRVAVGARVTLKDIASGKQIRYTLVDVREADVASGKISTVSPVGQALLDRSIGEEIAINVPKGTLRYVVEEIGG